MGAARMLVLSSRVSNVELDQSLLHRDFMSTKPFSKICCVLKNHKLYYIYGFLYQGMDFEAFRPTQVIENKTLVRKGLLCLNWNSSKTLSMDRRSL